MLYQSQPNHKDSSQKKNESSLSVLKMRGFFVRLPVAGFRNMQSQPNRLPVAGPGIWESMAPFFYAYMERFIFFTANSQPLTVKNVMDIQKFAVLFGKKHKNTYLCNLINN